MELDLTTTAGLWLAVIVSGLYHGVNPGMGWPLAVSAGLMGKGRGDLVRSLVPLAGGHMLAMMLVLLPFAFLIGLLEWQREIQIGASLILIAAGIYLYFDRRHPRLLARIAPHKLGLWSFAIALAHGAGLMLVPIYLGLCDVEELDAGHNAAATLMGTNLAAAFGVAIAHGVAMTVAGGLIAVLVHDWLGLKFLTQSWFNLDGIWAISLAGVGVTSLAVALYV